MKRFEQICKEFRTQGLHKLAIKFTRCEDYPDVDYSKLIEFIDKWELEFEDDYRGTNAMVFRDVPISIVLLSKEMGIFPEDYFSIKQLRDIADKINWLLEEV